MARSKHKGKSGVYAPGRVLAACRQRFHLGGSCKKDVVFDAVAKFLGVPMPETKRERYLMCQQVVGVNGQKGKPCPGKKSADVNSGDFLTSYAWRRLRMEVLVERGTRCECCGATPKDGIVIHVDHIKPRRQFPELALEKSNLQVLCEVCNHGKGNWDQTDWRADTPPPVLVEGLHHAVAEQETVNEVRNGASDMRPRLVKIRRPA